MAGATTGTADPGNKPGANIGNAQSAFGPNPPFPSSQKGANVIVIDCCGFNPNLIRILSISGMGGVLSFINADVVTRAVVGLGGQTAFNTGNLAPGAQYNCNIASLTPGVYTFYDSTRTHMQGILFLAQ